MDRVDETLLGASAAMQRLRQRVRQAARAALPVLVLGETGSGKEVVARALHAVSGRSGAFVAVDCAAIASTLVESELFGHERGSFTGATHSRVGLVQAAHRGTFFLDEIAELPLAGQTRLLRLLQEGTYRPVGGNDERRVDLRVVAATWQDLPAAVRDGKFRADLWHRLAGVELRLPPLRERPDDAEELLRVFVEQACAADGRAPVRLEPALLEVIRAWPWPGNVRELRNVAQFVAAFARGDRAGVADLPPALRRAPRLGAVGAATVRLDLPYMEARRAWLDEFQWRYVEAQLEAHDGNVSAAARAAGMDRRSIQRIVARARGEAEVDDG